MPTTTRSRRTKALAAACALALLATACGDDEETEAAGGNTPTTAAEGEPAGGEFDEYCTAVAEMDESEEFDVAQFERIKETAPDEIRAEIEYVADAFIDSEGDVGKVFTDPEVEAKLEPIEAFEAENCPSTGDDEGGDEGEDEPVTEPLEGAEVIPVTAVDFGFEGIPATVPAGDVSFELSNEGEAAHEMALFKLGEGVQLDDLLGSEEEPTEDQAQEVGFTFARPGEGGHYLNAEDLDAGTYAVVCFIPGPEGKSHHELGMKTTFTVG